LLQHVEVIFVDSGSPTNEYTLFREAVATSPLPYLYARTRHRETIQAAWNRGILLSRAPFLAFLGVDEGIHPSALEILAEHLEQNPSCDWVIGNSVVTAVDQYGRFDHDIMLYDRTGYFQELTYLDTTFLSWVGGLYRRNLHDRVGFYDESFRAAGDTEFKMRAMPHCRSAHIPLTLGVFNNYPDERTTQHPRAEIEDLRAWYLYRTKPGVAFAFEHASDDQVLRLLKASLGYRKCYCRHISTDFDLASHLAEHLAARGVATMDVVAGDLGSLTKAMRRLDTFPPFSGTALNWLGRQWGELHVKRVRRSFAEAAARHHRMLDIERPLSYRIFNDNRFEQHWWPWIPVGV
jgi:glycosyltransferase involved in cell wall biosynthesis